MHSGYFALIISLYFIVLLIISRITAKGATNETFFLGNRNSLWYLVAFGMIGTSLSGVTFISVPGSVGGSQFSYMQVVLGYLLGYIVVANVLMPLYYRLNLTSIYTYLEQRFGFWSYKTGAFYFILSRTLGAAFRLFLVANVLHFAIFQHWHIPFTQYEIPYALTVAITIVLIWIYTSKGGIKTIVWTDSFQTLFMLTAVGVTIYQIGAQLQLGGTELIDTIKNSDYSQTFFFDDWRDSKFFWKQFIGGAFITITMTGMDQDMMQKNLSCRNLKEAKWNMLSMSVILVFVNLLFLGLGAMLYIYSNTNGLEIPAKTDDLFHTIALGNQLGPLVAIFFILGIIAAAYSSADSALTALTTSVCVDFLAVKEKAQEEAIRLRKKMHILVSIALFLVIIIFSWISDENVINSLLKVAGYTYGPLLGLFAFGMFHKWAVKDKWVPILCIISPLLTYFIQLFSQSLLNGYQFGFEIIVLNGFITYLGLMALRTGN